MAGFAHRVYQRGNDHVIVFGDACEVEAEDMEALLDKILSGEIWGFDPAEKQEGKNE